VNCLIGGMKQDGNMLRLAKPEVMPVGGFLGNRNLAAYVCLRKLE
jgi:hypothetical protein